MIRCRAGCYPKKCVNYGVCGVTTVSPLDGEFCHLCTYLLACQKLEALPPAEAEPRCPICLEPAADQYKFPMCSRHGSCGPCMRRVLFGDAPRCGEANYTRKLWSSIADDDRIITLKQQCPVCRAYDSRSFIEKFESMQRGLQRTKSNEFAASAHRMILNTLKLALSVHALSGGEDNVR